MLDVNDKKNFVKASKRIYVPRQQQERRESHKKLKISSVDNLPKEIVLMSTEKKEKLIYAILNNEIDFIVKFSKNKRPYKELFVSNTNKERIRTGGRKKSIDIAPKEIENKILKEKKAEIKAIEKKEKNEKNIIERRLIRKDTQKKKLIVRTRLPNGEIMTENKATRSLKIIFKEHRYVVKIINELFAIKEIIFFGDIVTKVMNAKDLNLTTSSSAERYVEDITEWAIKHNLIESTHNPYHFRKKKNARLKLK
jgi:hypothetical protein